MQVWQNESMSSLGETLCRSCGLCCTGALFNVVVLDRAEVETSHRLKLRVVSSNDGRVGIKQPCSAFDGDCAVYEERPGKCRTFRCQLLADMEAAHFSLAEAQSAVRAMKEVIRQIESALPTQNPADPHPLRIRIAMENARAELPQHVVSTMLTYESLLASRFSRVTAPTEP